MQVSGATSPKPAQALQQAPAVRPRDADGDNDGTRASAPAANSAPKLAAAGQPGAVLHEVA